MTHEERTAVAGFLAAFDLQLPQLEAATTSLVDAFDWLPDTAKYTVPAGRTRSTLASLEFSLVHLRDAASAIRASLLKEAEES